MMSTLLDEVAEFSEQEIYPYAAKFDQEEAVSMELITKMGKKGYLAFTFPKEYMGMGLDAVTYGHLTEVIGKSCASTRALLTVNTSLVGEAILKFGNEAQKKMWLSAIAMGEKIGAFALTEPDVGSDAKSIKTSYIKKQNSYIINGNKKWITYAAIADFFLVIASNNGTISAFLVDSNTEGVTTKRITGLLASKGAYIAEIEFKNVEISKENLLGPEGSGFTYVVNAVLDHGRYSIAWAGVAIAQASLDAMVSYSRSRTQFGNSIYKYQLIQSMIANATTSIHAGRALCIEAGELRNKKSPDADIRTVMAKYFSSKVAMDVTRDGVQVHGGNGCSNNYPVERLYREAKILEIIEGSNEMQIGIISRYALRKYYKRDYYKL